MATTATNEWKKESSATGASVCTAALLCTNRSLTSSHTADTGHFSSTYSTSERGHCQADISTISGISTITTPAATTTTTEQVQIIVVVIIMIIIFFFFGALTVPTTIICRWPLVSAVLRLCASHSKCITNTHTHRSRGHFEERTTVVVGAMCASLFT